jgi:hypothetical protein
MAAVWQRLATAAFVATLASVAVAQPPKEPPLPLEVEFSVPVEGDADVRLDTTIRVKFSRDANPVSFADRIRASYSKEESAERGEAQPPPISFTTSYSSSTQVLEIAPRQPLERFRQVRVELLQGIVGQDGSVLRAWSLRFRTGGS